MQYDVSHFYIGSLIKVIIRPGTVIREEIGLSLDKADKEVLGNAAKVVITKDSTTIVGDGTTQEEVTKRVTQIKNQIEVCIVNLYCMFTVFCTLFVKCARPPYAAPVYSLSPIKLVRLAVSGLPFL